MTDGVEVPGTGTRSVVGQVVAALVLVIPLPLGLWLARGQEEAAPDPSVCPHARAVDGPEVPALCRALNRPGLAALLGAPGARVTVDEVGAVTLPGGVTPDNTSAEVSVGEYRVRLTDNREVSAADAVYLSSRATDGTLPGHRAVAFTEATMGISLDLFGGGGGKAVAGGEAQHLAVAKGLLRSGGSYQLTVWRSDLKPVDPGTVRRIATEVLPALPEWIPDTAAPPVA
ncbi:DUF6215 domain-containing protein [Kitasatospora sp. NPDC096147]|uniref:DUF6215 domain-containing protein n=1 Tax=Kitasatospora sp. NPDC096147 TaxID=3364093 RepID=UPI0038169D16